MSDHRRRVAPTLRLAAAAFLTTAAAAIAQTPAPAPDCAAPGQACAQPLRALCAESLGRAELTSRRAGCAAERDAYLQCLARTREACGAQAASSETLAVACDTFDFTHRALKFKGGVRFLPDNIFHLPLIQAWGVFDRDAESYRLTFQDARYRLDRASGELWMFRGLAPTPDERGLKIAVCRRRGGAGAPL